MIAPVLIAQYTYAPPKVVSRAPASVEPKGAGSVTVQVMVNPDGSFKVIRVLRSTNSADNAAALDIARHSTYAPARRNGKPVRDFYDFTIAFGRQSVSSAASQIDTLLHRNQWAQAKAAADRALAQNPDDKLVQAQLGVADAVLHDIPGSVAAFDRAGTVPPQYQNVAMQAYALDAQSKVHAQPKAALNEALKAVGMGGDYSAYYALGSAQIANGDNNGAEISLEKAKAMAADATPPAGVPTRIGIDEQLLVLATERNDGAAVSQLTAEINSLDPSMGTKAAAYAYDQQGVYRQAHGDTGGAVKFYEQAAQADPKWAGPLEYTKAAILLASTALPNYLGAEDAAKKAIQIDPGYALGYYVLGVVLAQNATVSGNDNDAQDANLYLNKAAALAAQQGQTQLAQAAKYIEQNHNANANLQFWSTQITLFPAGQGSNAAGMQ